MIPSTSNHVIVALDVPTVDRAIELTRLLKDHVAAVKVGLELFHAVGPSIFRDLRHAGAERIWYDGKFNDIPNTMAGATRALSPHGLWMINVHALAGEAGMTAVRQAAEVAAREAGQPRPWVMAVTLLTSLTEASMNEEMGMPGRLTDHVVRLARLAQDTGLDGAITSPLEAAAVRAACGPTFLIVTPGVRSAKAESSDQRRVATPGEAVASGASYVVIGREITRAADPVHAAIRLSREAGSAR